MIRAASHEDSELIVVKPEDHIWNVVENPRLHGKAKSLQRMVDVPFDHLPIEHRTIVEDILDTKAGDKNIQLNIDPITNSICKTLRDAIKRHSPQGLSRIRFDLLSTYVVNGNLDKDLKWLMPIPLNPLTYLDLTSIYMEEVLRAYRVNISAGIKVNPTAPGNWRTMAGSLPESLEEDILDSLSPSIRPTSQFAFYNTVVTSEDDYPLDHKPTWEDLTGVNRLSCVTALRQQRSFNINTPVFGIIFRSSRTRMQVTWHERVQGRSICVSANVTCPVTRDSESDYDEEEHEPAIKEWDLKKERDLQEFSGILKRLNSYTISNFSQNVSEGLAESVESMQNGTWELWKWSIEDDEYANPGTNDLSAALRRSLWDNWLWNRSGTQATLSMSSGPSNSIGLTEEDGHISTPATSLDMDDLHSEYVNSGRSILALKNCSSVN